MGKIIKFFDLKKSCESFFYYIKRKRNDIDLKKETTFNNLTFSNKKLDYKIITKKRNDSVNLLMVGPLTRINH